MSILVVGTMAFDSIQTPMGKAEDTLGGSSVYFSLSASHFSPVRLVSVVGEDFPESSLGLLREKGVDLAGVEKVSGKTFRWAGKYEGDMNEAITLDTQLNVYGNFEPKVPAAFRDTSFLFLANGAPRTQLMALDQMTGGPFVAADTMNLWIETKRPELLAVLKRVDLLTINDGEARLLTQKRGIIRSGRAILDLGPKIVVIKSGEYGAYMFSKNFEFALPAYPTAEVQDPTGAGDTFAGGLLGYLASCPALNETQIRLAMAYGTIMSSFTVEQFGTEGLRELNRDMVEARLREFQGFIRL